MIADALGHPLHWSPETEATSRGAALLALSSLGVLADFAQARRPLGEPILPDPAAHARYGEALALADALGMRPLVAHCRLGLGRLYQRMGQRGPAREHLASTATMYRAMEMTYWLEHAQTALAAVGAS